MRTRQLGKDGPHVPVVCLGAWPLGGAFGALPEQQAVDTIHTAIDLGLNFIDAAENYVNSQEIIGKAVAGKRDQVFLTSKLSRPDHSAEAIRDSLETSLRLLDTDYVDLYQLHSPQPKWPIEETIGHLMKHRDEGKLRYIGISNFDAQQTEEAARAGPIHSSQPRYSMLFRDSEVDVLPTCLQLGIGTMAYSVMAKGLLGGKYKPGVTFAPDDERHYWPYFQGEMFEQIYAVTEKLNVWARDHGRDIVQLAIAWPLANPAVTTSIVGARTPDQVRHDAVAADWELTEQDLREIDEIQGDLRLRAVPIPQFRKKKDE